MPRHMEPTTRGYNKAFSGTLSVCLTLGTITNKDMVCVIWEPVTRTGHELPGRTHSISVECVLTGRYVHHTMGGLSFEISTRGVGE